MRILVIGGGGREHAFVTAIHNSSKTTKIYCIPGNPGIAALAECISLDSSNPAILCQFAMEHAIDLTVVGPEVCLAAGVVDAFQKQGLKIFGPTRAAAELESSKTYAKELMKKYAIPTANYEVFTDAAAAKKYIECQGAPIVIKADGLAAGKGVVVAQTIVEACQAVDSMLADAAFGDAGSRVVIEECLVGQEASVLAFTDGYTIQPMVASQDHKRVFDGDEGPNTGGMGTYAPAPVVTTERMQWITQHVLQPTIDAMRAEGRLYSGCLYAGLMITEQGPKVIEFNARFGDPETQVVLPLLKTDFITVMEHCIEGTLQELDVEWNNGACVCVVLASGGYPGSYEQGLEITGLDDLLPETYVFHAGTAKQGDKLVTAGGRVLGVTSQAANLKQAVNKVYQEVPKIHFKDCHYRTDIAAKAFQK
ncbi:phosphoribosylamine--glycine ligase [Sporomusaceae bacterium BoRhaA]|uniref:phosphoribosylamine--glycine ligase n=1 Tax=Pelorhabdus rhamnosifermentans TaxID=2772457 RepID=UPI001C06392A|nr:phosphoribosylamine--glycine ligase [Pelorhabdus rhamnosifermentans]MBU2702874.1 phosphoribosylamine--glycine ligase [Pelorhabdus rhamnosifermentans]